MLWLHSGLNAAAMREKSASWRRIHDAKNDAIAGEGDEERSNAGGQRTIDEYGQRTIDEYGQRTIDEYGQRTIEGDIEKRNMDLFLADGGSTTGFEGDEWLRGRRSV